MKGRHLLIFLILAFYCLHAVGQKRIIDSLRQVLKTDKEDTNKVNALIGLAFSIYTIKPDSTILLAEEARSLAEKLDWSKGMVDAYQAAGGLSWARLAI